jgi:sulfite exporter TauE/SafE
MAAFWFGSLPMLLGLGGLVSLLGAKSRRYLPQVSTLVLLGLGLSTVILRRPPLLFASSLEAASAASNAQTSSCHHH